MGDMPFGMTVTPTWYFLCQLLTPQRNTNDMWSLNWHPNLTPIQRYGSKCSIFESDNNIVTISPIVLAENVWYFGSNNMAEAKWPVDTQQQYVLEKFCHEHNMNATIWLKMSIFGSNNNIAITITHLWLGEAKKGLHNFLIFPHFICLISCLSLSLF